MSLATKQKRRRNRLFQQDPHCYWCGIRVRHPSEFMDEEGKMRPGDKDDMATLDHLDSKLSNKRGQHAPGEERTVLCCNACNNWRSHDEQKQLGKDELRARSGRYPREASA